MAERGARNEATRGTQGEATDELYLGDFEGFVARRAELAKRLGAAGDREEADRVRALKKPSRVAWAINQVSADHAELRDGLLAASTALRKAQEQLLAGKAKGAELRKASEQEQAAVHIVLDAVVAVSKQAGAALSPAAVERARQTLHAVALEENVRRAFERHRLIADHESSGLDGFSMEVAPGGGKPGAKRSATSGEQRREAQRLRAQRSADADVRRFGEREQKAERELEDARRNAEQAQRDLERAKKTVQKAANDAAAARERAAQLRERSD